MKQILTNTVFFFFLFTACFFSLKLWLKSSPTFPRYVGYFFSCSRKAAPSLSQKLGLRVRPSFLFLCLSLSHPQLSANQWHFKGTPQPHSLLFFYCLAMFLLHFSFLVNVVVSTSTIYILACLDFFLFTMMCLPFQAIWNIHFDELGTFL